MGNQCWSHSISTWHAHSDPSSVRARVCPAGARPGFLLFVFGVFGPLIGPVLCQFSPCVALVLPRYPRPVPLWPCAPRAPPETLLQPPEPRRARRPGRQAGGMPGTCGTTVTSFYFFDLGRWLGRNVNIMFWPGISATYALACAAAGSLRAPGGRNSEPGSGATIINCASVRHEPCSTLSRRGGVVWLLLPRG